MKINGPLLVILSLCILPIKSFADSGWHYYVLSKGNKIESMAGPFQTLDACKQSLAGNQSGIRSRGLQTTDCMQKARN